MKTLLRKALTRTVWVKADRKKAKQIVVTPSDRLVYGVYFAMITLVCLTVLEATYIYVLHNFSNEIFAAIMLTVGTILGAFFGQKA